ncbi:unnamed protein product [Adineta steineri]|uniref:G-protein coupled receptors family 1 profile domain-containing protein n=1 Tax=Adineta steineri TaxID=433720 RepID=A0A819QSM4_9BILA|nr:unnamed protein product [Adineta steineri]CAF4040121.1 unnamed protein product [Adineta steineri]
MELFTLTTNITIIDMEWFIYPVGLFLFLLCLFTIVGNMLIIYVIIHESTLHTSKYYYIASLAFADLIVGLIVMPFAFIFTLIDDEYWLISRYLRFLCDFWHAVDIFASTASILGLCTIGIDRYITIKKPIQHPNSFISKRWYLMLSFIWICSALISFPAIIYWGTKHSVSDKSIMSNDTLLISSSLLEQCGMPNNSYYILFSSIASFYIPSVLMIYVYIKIYLAAKNQTVAIHSGYIRHHHLIKFHCRKPLTNENSEITTADRNSPMERSDLSLGDHELSNDIITVRIHRGTYQKPTTELHHQDNIHKATSRKSKRTKRIWRMLSKTPKATRFVGVVMGTFLICWLPYFFYLVLSGAFGVRLKNDQHHKVLYNILSWFGYSNSALDIVVYVFTSTELRTIFTQLFFHSYCSNRITS